MKVSFARGLKFISGAVVLAASGLSAAQVTSYDAFRTQFMTQTSDAAPTSVDAYQFATRIFLTNPTDADTGTLTDPSGNNNYTLTPQTGDYLFYADPSSASQAAEESTYPTGTYTYTLNGGTNGYDGNSATLQVMPSDFSTTVPFLTGTTYDQLQGMNANQNLSLSWNSFVDTLGNSDCLTFFGITDLATGVSVYGNSGEASAYTGDMISAGELQAGTTYQYTLFFSSRYLENNWVTDPTNAFFGVQGLSAFDIGTSGTFTTAPAPEPASLLALASISAGVIRLRKRRR